MARPPTSTLPQEGQLREALRLTPRRSDWQDKPDLRLIPAVSDLGGRWLDGGKFLARVELLGQRQIAARDSPRLRLVLTGERAAMVLTVLTGWSFDRNPDAPVSGLASPLAVANVTCPPAPLDLGYHSLVPRMAGHQRHSESCDHCGGHPCYYSGSAAAAVEPMRILLRDGPDAVWPKMILLYVATFGEPRALQVGSAGRASPVGGSTGRAINRKIDLE